MSTETAQHPGVRLPVALVDDTPQAFAASSALAEAAGLRVKVGWSIAPKPWDLTSRALVVVGSISDDMAEHTLVEAVVRGAGAILGTRRDQPHPARLIDALRRAAPVLDHRECQLLRLDVEQICLLRQLAEGASTREAAAAAHLSVRTAHRRLAEARDLLGTPSTMTAAAEVQAAARAWTG